MSRIGTWSGAAALVLGAIVAGTWDAAAETSATPVVTDGSQLFVTKGCSACHVGPDSTPARIGGFPPLDDAVRWAGDRQPGLTAHEYLAQSMVAPDAYSSPRFQPGQMGPTTAMPVLRLTAEEVDVLVAYLLEE